MLYACNGFRVRIFTALISYFVGYVNWRDVANNKGYVNWGILFFIVSILLVISIGG